MDDPVQLRPRNSRRYVIYFARQQSNNLSIDQIISFSIASLRFPRLLASIFRFIAPYRAPRITARNLPHCQHGRSRPPRPPSHPPIHRPHAVPRIKKTLHLAVATPQNLGIDRRLPGRMRWSSSAQQLLRKHPISFVSVHLPMRQNRGSVDI